MKNLNISHTPIRELPLNFDPQQLEGIDLSYTQIATLPPFISSLMLDFNYDQTPLFYNILRQEEPIPANPQEGF